MRRFRLDHQRLEMGRGMRMRLFFSFLVLASIVGCSHRNEQIRGKLTDLLADLRWETAPRIAATVQAVQEANADRLSEAQRLALAEAHAALISVPTEAGKQAIYGKLEAWEFDDRVHGGITNENIEAQLRTWYAYRDVSRRKLQQARDALSRAAQLF